MYQVNLCRVLSHRLPDDADLDGLARLLERGNPAPHAGRIAVGMRADLTGFAADPVECPADELPALPVLLTVVDGEAVFRAAT